MPDEIRPQSGWREKAFSFTRWRRLTATTDGERLTVTWSTFIQWLRSPSTIASIESAENALDGWSPALFNNDRRNKASCIALDALVIDYDAAGPGAVAACWDGYAGVAHTTKRHTLDKPRCRVILPYVRPIAPEEHDRLWAWADTKSKRAGLLPDPNARDSSRFWFSPARLPEAPYEVRELEGTVLDPTAIQTSVTSTSVSVLEGVLQAAAGSPVRVEQETRRTRGPEERRFTGPPTFSLEQLFQEIEKNFDGNRNGIISKNAFFVFQRVDQGELTEEVARDRLLKSSLLLAERTNPTAKTFLDELEIRRTIEGARSAAAEKPRPLPLSLVRDPIARAFEGFSDLDYAAGFILQHGINIRFANQWLVWDERRWTREGKNSARTLLQDYTREVTERALGLEDEAKRASAYGRAKKAESSVRLSGALTCAANEAEIRLDPEDLDKQDMKLSCMNGTIDLRTGALFPFSRDDLITQLVPTAYKPDAKAPRWEQFLREVTSERENLINFLHRWVGYCLTGSVVEQCFVLCTGEGQNGKGKLFEALRTVLGNDIAGPQPPKLLLETRNERHPTELKTLERKRIVFVSEVPTDARFDEERVKLLSGGDTFSARGMREDFAAVRPTAKLFLAVNNKPSVRDHSFAFWRRVRLIPFDVTFTGDRKDPSLLDKLIAEAEGILAWAVRGCLLWQREGLQAPLEVITATETYRNEQDAFQRFLDDYRANGRPLNDVASGDVFQAYATWAERERIKPVTQIAFGLQLKRLGLFAYRKAGKRYWSAQPRGDES